MTYHAMPGEKHCLAASSHKRGGCKVSQGAHAFRASLWAKRLAQAEAPIQTPSAKPFHIQKPLGVGDFMALKQACSTDCHRAQGAFKDSMIHGILQFTLPIAFRCVLHRWENQEIRCRKLCIVCWPVTVQPSSTFILTIRVCSEERPQERPQNFSRSLSPRQCTRVCGCIVGVGGQGHFFGVRMACPNLH